MKPKRWFCVDCAYTTDEVLASSHAQARYRVVKMYTDAFHNITALEGFQAVKSVRLTVPQPEADAP